MSDNFSNQNKITKITSSIENDNYFHALNEGVNIDDLSLPYDHMYASSNSVVNGIETSETTTNCQTSESEVKFLKEWLVIHLDLIQQQNDEILSKEKTIYILKQENEKLKEKLHCIQKNNSMQNNKIVNNHKPADIIIDTLEEDMTQDLGSIDEDSIKTAESLGEIGTIIHFEDNHENNLINSAIASNIHTDILTEEIEISNHIDSKNQLNHLDRFPESKYEGSYTIHNSTENDSMKNLKMSIRRKRLCSSSSAFSNNDAFDDKRNFRRIKKRRKKLCEAEHILMCNEQYVTHSGETNLSIIHPLDLTNDLPANSAITNLEVPRWRIKSYTSCYTMEGTENLEDEVFNKRHSRLENDERRRKRWDVQRIREQRLIEKLKQRQEKVGSNSRNDDSEPLESLWPSMEDIKYVEVCDHLPVSAFGSPVTKVQYSDFCLPWINHANSGTSRKGNTRKSRAKRRCNTKR